MDGLTPKQAAFVREYLVDLNGAQAAIRAGYSAATAKEQASRLLTDVNVASTIEKAMNERAERVEITADMVLKRWWEMATADPNDLVEVRRVPCPECFKEEPGEKRDRPDPECLLCYGDGHQTVFMKDSRDLTGPAKLLYAGAKQTRDGCQILMNSQPDALVNVAKHLGMFTEKVDLTTNGKDLQSGVVIVQLPDNGRDSNTSDPASTGPTDSVPSNEG